jgi:hypothetical protein
MILENKTGKQIKRKFIFLQNMEEPNAIKLLQEENAKLRDEIATLRAEVAFLRSGTVHRPLNVVNNKPAMIKVEPHFNDPRWASHEFVRLEPKLMVDAPFASESFSTQWNHSKFQ